MKLGLVSKGYVFPYIFCVQSLTYIYNSTIVSPYYVHVHATHSISNLLLRLLSKIAIDMHYSFGDKKNVEYAHIVFPLWSFVDKLVITKNGECPPPLGEVFEESSQSVSMVSNIFYYPFYDTLYVYAYSHI